MHTNTTTTNIFVLVKNSNRNSIQTMPTEKRLAKVQKLGIFASIFLNFMISFKAFYFHYE